jgi:hypothetical protein
MQDEGIWCESSWQQLNRRYTHDEVRKILRGLKWNKACGTDGVQTVMLSAMADSDSFVEFVAEWWWEVRGGNECEPEQWLEVLGKLAHKGGDLALLGRSSPPQLRTCGTTTSPSLRPWSSIR